MSSNRLLQSGEPLLTGGGDGPDDDVQDGENVETAYLRSLPMLRRYVKRLLYTTHPVDEVEDIVQETYVRAYAAKKSEKLRYARAYLFRVACHLSFKARARNASAVVKLIEDFAVEGIMDHMVPQDEQLHQKRRLAVFYQVVARLPNQCRQVFLLRHEDGLSHQEISKRLGISTSTVEKHIAKGLRLSGGYMNELGYETTRDAQIGVYPKLRQMKD